MAESTAPRPAGSIYDLGYRRYDGPRLGRRYALGALYNFSFRAAFGIGRSLVNKVFPSALTTMALGPAMLQLGIAALSPVHVELVSPSSYFGYVQIIVALFCAVVAPELACRDQRNRTLALYFSRALARQDYVLAKLGALFVALLLLLLVPQITLFVGAAVSTQAVLRSIWDNLDIIPPVLGSSLVASAMLASLSLALACHTSKRAMGTGVVIAFFTVLAVLGGGLVTATTGTGWGAVILISPLDTAQGMVDWMFGATSPADSPIGRADLPGGVYFLTCLAYIGVALTVLFRRFLRLVV